MIGAELFSRMQEGVLFFASDSKGRILYKWIVNTEYWILKKVVSEYHMTFWPDRRLPAKPPHGIYTYNSQFLQYLLIHDSALNQETLDNVIVVVVIPIRTKLGWKSARSLRWHPFHKRPTVISYHDDCTNMEKIEPWEEQSPKLVKSIRSFIFHIRILLWRQRNCHEESRTWLLLIFQQESMKEILFTYLHHTQYT